jgi:hypothetical protein
VLFPSFLPFFFFIGSQWEVFFSLMGFGIVKESLPFDVDGTVQLKGFFKYIKRLEEKELAEQVGLEDRILTPLSNDVLLGRGRPYQEFPGNLRLAEIIDEYREAYQSESKLQKTAMSNKVVTIIKKGSTQASSSSGGGGGGRFLKKKGDSDPGNKIGMVVAEEWVEVVDDVARDKVSHGFRTKTRRLSVTTAAPAAKGVATGTIIPATVPSGESSAATKKKKPRTA